MFSQQLDFSVVAHWADAVAAPAPPGPVLAETDVSPPHPLLPLPAAASAAAEKIEVIATPELYAQVVRDEGELALSLERRLLDGLILPTDLLALFSNAEAAVSSNFSLGTMVCDAFFSLFAVSASFFVISFLFQFFLDASSHNCSSLRWSRASKFSCQH